jgi:hypothetical protein
MSEADEEDVKVFTNRHSLKKEKNGDSLGGTKTFAGIYFYPHGL